QGEPGNMKWEAINSLYCGWQNLLATSTQTIPSTRASGWQGLWKRPEGEVAVRQTWPGQPYQDLEDKAAALFSTKDVKDPELHYASSVNADKPLGCDLKQLPATRDNGMVLALDRPSVHNFDLLGDSAGPPEIPPAMGKDYCGEMIALDPKVKKDF